jgi:transcription antitermination factor NusG
MFLRDVRIVEQPDRVWTTARCDRPVSALSARIRSSGHPGSNMPSWFAIRVSPRSELRSSSELSLRGLDTYLPVCRLKRQWSDRIKVVEQPLFPGYLFARFCPEERVRVLQAPGVRQIVGIGANPASISDSELDNLRALVSSKRQLVPWPYIEAGQRIRIDCGPLAGVAGFVVRAEQGEPRIVVSVNLLLRSVAAEISRECISLVR